MKAWLFIDTPKTTFESILRSVSSSVQNLWKRTLIHANWVAGTWQANTEQNTVISTNFLLWKFCGNTQSFKWFTRNSAETVCFHKFSTPGNQVKFGHFKSAINASSYSLEFVNPLMANVSHDIETSQLICSANQLTGFYIMENTGR